MSAVNIIPTGTGAVILTDAAVYDTSGVLIDLTDKCHVTKNGKLAVAGRGNAQFPQLIADLLSDRDWTIDDVRADAGDLMDRALAHLEDAFVTQTGKARNDVYVVGWSPAEGAVLTAAWSTLNEPRFSIGADMMWLAPSVTPDQIARARTAAVVGAKVDIGTFGLEVMKMQRLDKGDIALGNGNNFSVGGHVMRTDVSAEGILQQVIHTWPEDQIGSHIRPIPAIDPVAHSNVTPITGMNRAERRRMEKQNRKAVA